MNRKWRLSLLLIFAAFSMALVAGGCAGHRDATVREVSVSKDSEARGDVTALDRASKIEEQTLEAAEGERLRRERAVKEAKMFEAKPIHFHFDRHDLTPEARAVLDELGAWLRENKDFELLIEGHCDNRGSPEYNLALGERRAESAKEYLVNLGVEPGRIRTISYGLERPVDPRNNEEAWAKNRRDEFRITPR